MAADEPTILPSDLFLDLDRSGPIPLYYQVSNRLEAAIRSGVILPGAHLENETLIGQRLGLSRPTVRRAIAELVNKGLVVRRRAIGTQVVQTIGRDTSLASLFEDLAGASLNPSTTILAHEILQATEDVADKLGIAPGTDIFHLRRIRFILERQPVALLENFLPVECAEITPVQLENHGLYQLMQGRGFTIQVVQQKIGAREATDDEAELLELPAGGFALKMDRIAFNSGGLPVDYSHHLYRPDKYTFESTLVAK